MKNIMNIVLKEFKKTGKTSCGNVWCNCIENTMYYLSQPDFTHEEIIDRIKNIRCEKKSE